MNRRPPGFSLFPYTTLFRSVSFIDFYDDIQDVQAGDPLVSVEGSKAVTELEAPINGKVIKANLDLADNPEKINSHDHQDNWIVELAK